MGIRLVRLWWIVQLSSGEYVEFETIGIGVRKYVEISVIGIGRQYAIFVDSILIS